MPRPVSAARLDAGSVCRLTQEIKEFCERRELQHQYVGASSVFFAHVAEVADSILRFIAGLDLSDTRSQRRLKAERLKLGSIKAYWSAIHELLKPAANAHTLTIPTALVEVLCASCRSIPSITHARITVLLSEQFNYFQRQHTGLKELYTDLHAVVPGLPDFPNGLGFIGVPFSQGSSLFTNLVVFHERAHFVFEETVQGPQLESATIAAISAAFKGSHLSKSDELWAKQIVLRWAEEIFCDLLAVRIIGPAYTFAYLELINVTGGTNQRTASIFHTTHPADACRLREHIGRLNDDGWQEVVANLDVEHTATLNQLTGIPDTQYRLMLDDKPMRDAGFIQAFLDTLPTVRSIADAVLPINKDAPQRYKNFKTDIYRCLAQGIVPSAAFDAAKVEASDIGALINAAFTFYLEDMSTLISNIADETESDVFALAKWSKRVEMWTSKSIENLMLRNLEADIGSS